MTELLLVACSILQGATCKEVSLVYADVSILTCMTMGMPEVARWADEHPNYTIAKWTCRPAGQYANL